VFTENLSTRDRHRPSRPSICGYRDRVEALTGISLRTCPRCHAGQMVAIVVDVPAWSTPTIMDTS
jgi:hypothetical protein